MLTAGLVVLILGGDPILVKNITKAVSDDYTVLVVDEIQRPVDLALLRPRNQDPGIAAEADPILEYIELTVEQSDKMNSLQRRNQAYLKTASRWAAYG